MAMNLQFLIFRKGRTGDIKGYECSFVGGGSNEMPLAVHCLLHHGGEKFDVLTIAEPAKSEEVSTRLIKMGHALQKRSEEFSESMAFADVEDDTKVARAVISAGSYDASTVTVLDTDDEDGEEDEDCDDEDGEDDEDCDSDDGVLTSASAFAGRLLLALGSSDGCCSTINSTPVNASSLGALNTTTTKPRELDMSNRDKVSPACRGEEGRDSPIRDDDDIVGLLAQDDAALRHQDSRDGTFGKKQKKVSTNDFAFFVCHAVLYQVTYITDITGSVKEIVEMESECSDYGDEEDDEDVDSYKADDAIETKLRRDYGVNELEADGCPIQTFHIGGVTRNFEVLPRSPHHKKGQRVRCICQHVEKVSPHVDIRINMHTYNNIYACEFVVVRENPSLRGIFNIPIS